jgi:hypothetical protein
MIQAINYNTNFNFYSSAITQTQVSPKSLQLVRDDLVARIQKLYILHQEWQKDSLQIHKLIV